MSVEAIVAAALDVADRRGSLESMTMAEIARELSVGTMSLYTHVPSKAELIDLMVDAAWRELDLPRIASMEPSDWRRCVHLYAERVWSLYRRHPWLREISTVRPPLGPGLLARQEYLLGVMQRKHLDAGHTSAAVTAITMFVDAAAAAEASRIRAEVTTGQSEDAWWGAQQQFWEKIYAPERYPATTRAWEQGALSQSGDEAAASAREHGLRWLLDGIELSNPLSDGPNEKH